MARSATEVMHDVIAAAVVDAVGALKSGAGNLPNTILRDLGAIHANTAFADLPEAVRKAIETSVRDAFTKLLREGYQVSSGTPGQRPSGPPRDRVPSRAPGGRPPPRHGGERGGRDGGARPPRKPGDRPSGPKPR